MQKHKTVHPIEVKKESEKPKVEENLFFGSGDAFKSAEADILAAGNKIEEAKKSLDKKIDESKGEIDKTRQMQMRVIDQIDDDNVATTIIDATIDETFDHKLKFDTVTGVEAVKMVSLWLYTNAECKQNFREYNSIKSDVAYYLSKSVAPVVHEDARLATFFINIFTPFSKHYFTKPVLSDANKDQFIEAVKKECKEINRKYNVKTRNR